MFRPTGANTFWVPLKRMHWSWRGTAERVDETDWVMTSNPNDYTVEDAVEQIEEPDWTQRESDIQFELEF